MLVKLGYEVEGYCIELVLDYIEDDVDCIIKMNMDLNVDKLVFLMKVMCDLVSLKYSLILFIDVWDFEVLIYVINNWYDCLNYILDDVNGDMKLKNCIIGGKL